MLSQLNVSFLNHLLAQQPWAKDKLCVYAGKTVRLEIPPISLLLLIESNGEFSALNTDLKNYSAPDATLVLPPFAALRMALHGTLDTSQITMQGDTELAASVGKVLRELSWDVEEDLSHLVGDIPANKIISMGKQFLQQGKQQSANLAAMLAEYWQEENPLITKRRHLERFAAEVDELRDATERLAKRIEALNKSSD
ncbi:MAG TPA: SCP2 sterol-binding domain-containing protein [Methylophilaceae bacterium]|jgi:ubiquinone biosynthesis protein UbiJ